MQLPSSIGERFLGVSNKQNQTPFFPFLGDKHKTIKIGNHEVLEYISPDEMSGVIDKLAQKINLNDYAAVLVNVNGGEFLYKELVKRNLYHGPVARIEYHRPKDGFGARIVTPVPKELEGRKLAVIDDILDSGGVFRSIEKSVGRDSTFVALVRKLGVKNQIKIPNTIVGVNIGKVWVGGSGMDMGFEENDDIFRDYGGIVAMPNSV